MKLEQYRKEVANLSINEQKLRDLYLRDLALGKLQGPPTGYASLDKPWLKYYRENPIKEINPNETMYEMVFCQENMNAEAIGYLGTTWTYMKLKKEVDRCADAFNKMGIKFGDVILVGVSNSPESIVNLLALNKLGAVSKWFDLRASSKDIIEYANSSNCKYMIAFDIIIPKVEEAINDTNLEKIIVTSPVGPLPKSTKMIFNLKNKLQGKNIEIPKDNRYIKYEDFIKLGSNNSDIKCVEFDKNRPTIMIQSSGTTGKPKTIVHSDYSITQCTREIAYSDLPLGKNKKILVALPPWIAYGIGNAMVLPLTLGTKIELCPNFDPDSVFKNIGKFTIAFAAPFHYRYLKDNMTRLNSKQKEAFKNIECFVSGGDKMSVEENKEFEKIFNTVVVNGYGNNEGWGVLTVNPCKNNKYGTVGIPKYDETIISYDPHGKKELQYGEIGEICSLANTQFLEYENNQEATNDCKKEHEDKKVWLHTGDLGFIDSDGYIHLGGRVKRVITRLGFKISAYTIEDNISKNDFVKECVAVSVDDELEEHVPMVYVTLKDEYLDDNEVEKTIFERCNRTLKEHEVPKYVRIVKELPYTQNGKYDFVKLEKEGNNFIKNIKKVKRIKKK